MDAPAAGRDTRLRVHVLGIGGIGTSAVALWARAREFSTTGSDRRESPIVAAARAAGASTRLAPWPEMAASADLFVAPSGVPASHPELGAATPIHRDDALARLAGARPVIGVVGPVHGSACALGLARACTATGEAGWAVGAVPTADDDLSHAHLGPETAPHVVELDPRHPLPAFEALRALVFADWPSDGQAFGYFGNTTPSATRDALERAASAQGARLVDAAEAAATTGAPLDHPGLEAARRAWPAVAAHGAAPRESDLARGFEAIAALDAGGVRGQLQPVGDGARHDFRTHGIAIAALCRDLAARGSVDVVLKAWSGSIHVLDARELAGAFASARQVFLLPPYDRADLPALASLCAALGWLAPSAWMLPEENAQALDTIARLCDPDGPADETLWLGGDDVADLARRFAAR